MLVVGVILLLTAIAGLLLMRHGGGEMTPEAVRLDAGDRSLVGDGERIYREACAGCHGAALEGQPGWRNRKPDGRLPAPPHDASGHTWHHPDGVLFLLTKYGPAAVLNDPAYPSDMPGFSESLSDRDIIAVLSYIKSTWPPEIRARHDAMNARAATD